MTLRRIAIGTLTLFLTVSAVADADPRLQDRVGTLATDVELDARGNLGGITVDRLGFIYVANFRDAVWRVSPEGEVRVLTRSLYGASGNAIDSRGRLYQANFLGNTITRIERTGEVETFAAGGLDGPVGIAIGPDDTLYVCNCRGNTLSRVSPAGDVEPFAKSELFACPNGITFDDQGTLYVTNFSSHDILSVSPDGEVGKFVTVLGGAGNAHIAFAKGFFYVTKIISNRLVKISADGDVQPLAGTGSPGHEDGPALEATFYRPNGIAVAPQENLLYVNTMTGAYSRPEPSKITLRIVQLVNLGDLLREPIDAGALDDAAALYRAYRADPVRGKENTSAEMIALGYRYLSDRNVAAAVEIFRLNAESYPDDATAHYQLGEAYRYAGRTQDAVAQYRKVLELEPEDPRATSRLAQLGRD